jgi:acyl-CoA thioesterase
MPSQENNLSSIRNPFLDYLGFDSAQMHNGEASIQLSLKDHHMNSWKITHGGVMMTMLDVVMAMAARSVFDDQKAVVTIEMKNSFFQAGGVIGGQLVAKAKVSHQMANLCFCESEIWNGLQLVAKAMGTYQFLKSSQSSAALQRLAARA